MQNVQVPHYGLNSSVLYLINAYTRQELATREHMLDHGQLGPATPAVRSPAPSRRSSALSSHRPSMTQVRPGVGSFTESRPRRSSHLLGDSLTMTTAEDLDPLSNSALEDNSDEDEPSTSQGMAASANLVYSSAEMSDETAKILGRRMSDTMRSPLTASKKPSSEDMKYMERSPEDVDNRPPETTFISPVDFSAALNANPNLAALRSQAPLSKVSSLISAPILANPKCSGYFVEPVCIIVIASLSPGGISNQIQDEMDGAFPRSRPARRKDYLSEFKV